MRTIEPSYRCHECGMIHDDDYDARYCCPLDEVYVCPVCDIQYTDAVDAESCCTDEDSDLPLFPTAAELEAAGQIRLIP